MMSNDNQRDEETGRRVTPKTQISVEDQMDAILNNPRKKAALLLKMGLDDPGEAKKKDKREDNGEGNHLTPSGKTTGGWLAYPPFWLPHSYPSAPFLGYPPFIGQGTVTTGHARGPKLRPLDEPGPSGLSTPEETAGDGRVSDKD